MMTREKNIILAARVISILFTPFYLPMVGLMALFAFSYLALMPWAYKLQVLIMVYVFTILLPTLLIHLYRRYRGWNLIELGHKERRLVPYVISIFCYFFCVYLMEALHIGRYRWCGRRPLRVRRVLRIQSRVVAHGGVRPGRLAGHQPHDPAPALAAAGGRRLYCGPRLFDIRAVVFVVMYM